MIDAYAVGGNGGSLAIKYWDILKFPNFDINKENEIVSLYYSPLNIYNPAECNFETFFNYDQQFNEAAGIYEIDKSLKYLQAKLDKAIQNIADNVEVDIAF